MIELSKKRAVQLERRPMISSYSTRPVVNDSNEPPFNCLRSELGPDVKKSEENIPFCRGDRDVSTQSVLRESL